MIHRIVEARSREEQPASLWKEQGPPYNQETWGVTYSDGKREPLFHIVPSGFNGAAEVREAVLVTLEDFGLDVGALLLGEQVRRQQEEQERARIWAEIAARAQQEMMNGMRANPYGYLKGAFDGWTTGNPFAQAPPMRPREEPRNPERDAALDKCRKLKRTAASSTFAGERDAANNRRQSIMEKHGIAEHEL